MLHKLFIRFVIYFSEVLVYDFTSFNEEEEPITALSSPFVSLPNYIIQTRITLMGVSPNNNLLKVVKTIACVLFSLQSMWSYSQYLTSARLTGLGNAVTAISDIGASQHNPAGIAPFKRPHISLSSEHKLAIKNLTLLVINGILPHRQFVWGLTIDQLGFEIYKEQKISISLARAFSPQFSFGINSNYHQININNYGSARTFSVDMGSQYKLSAQWAIGIACYNINLANFHQEQLLNIPAGFRIGTVWYFSDKAFSAIEFDKKIGYSPNVKFGIEYHPSQVLSLRGGLNTIPSNYYVGIGIEGKHWQLQVASQYQTYATLVSQYTLIHEF